MAPVFFFVAEEITPGVSFIRRGAGDDTLRLEPEDKLHPGVMHSLRKILQTVRMNQRTDFPVACVASPVSLKKLVRRRFRVMSVAIPASIQT